MSEHLILTIPNLMSPKQCEDLILFSEYRGYEEAKVKTRMGDRMLKSIRDNYRVQYTDEALAQELFDKIKDLVPAQFGEKKLHSVGNLFRFYRYEKGQRFNMHRDGQVHLADGVQSQLSFLVYLNQDFKEGQTTFQKGQVIEPKTGLGLCFVHHLKHKGEAVPEGIKYVLRSDIFYQ